METLSELFSKCFTVLGIFYFAALLYLIIYDRPVLNDSHDATITDMKPTISSRSDRTLRARFMDASKNVSGYGEEDLSIETTNLEGGVSEASISPDTESSSQESSDIPTWSRAPSQSDTNTSYSPTVVDVQKNHGMEALSKFMTERDGPWNPTHPSDSTMYQESLKGVLDGLDKAMRSSQWSRRHQSRYTDVRVLMLSWRNGSKGVQQELKRLEYCFANKYHFAVERFEIPDNENAPGATMNAILKFSGLNNDGAPTDWSQTLLILYYAGHGQRNTLGTHRWIPEGQDPDETTQTFVNPDRTVGMLADQSRALGFDALILLDCCHPMTPQPPESHMKDSVCEILAATGDGIARGPGDNSFTKLLIDELYVALETERRVSVVDLHSNLTARCLQPQNNVRFQGTSVAPVEDDSRPGHTKISWTVRRTPAHRFISTSTENHRSIVLGPLPKDSERPESPSNKVIAPGSSGGDVILAVHIDEDLQVAQPAVRRWLFDAPKAIREVKIWKIIPCTSSIMILQVPVDVWDLLPSSPAVTFLGFTKADRLQSTAGLPRWQMPIMDASNQIDNTMPDFFPTARLPYIWKAFNYGVVCEDGSYLAQNLLQITEFNPSEPLLTPTEKQEYLKSGRRLDSIMSNTKYNDTPERPVRKRVTWDGGSPVSPDQQQMTSRSRSIGAKGDRRLQSNAASSRTNSRYSSPARMSFPDREHSSARREESVPSHKPPSCSNSQMRSIESIAEIPDETQNSENIASGNSAESSAVDHETQAQDEGAEGEKLEDINEVDGDQLSTWPPSYFVPGRIFKMLWTEPLDQKAQNGNFRAHTRKPSTGMYLTGDIEGSDGEQRPFWVGFLRFIVVSNQSDSCLCVPISTYGGKGCTREEVRSQASTHGIIYQDGDKPEKLQGEPELGVPPVKMIVFGNKKDGENIARESRVNYAKLIKIKHYVKTMFIGELDADGKMVMERAVKEYTSEKK